MRYCGLLIRMVATLVLHGWLVQSAVAQTEAVIASPQSFYPMGETSLAGQSSAYPDGDFYEQLSVAGGEGGSCGPGCGDHWGCGGSPFRTGPGCGDDWRVGPRWKFQLDGLMLYRDETNLEALAVEMGTTLNNVDQFENFDHGGGVRLMGSAFWPQCKNYELVMSYIGVDEWNANIVLPVTVIPPVVGPPASVALDERRTLNYTSRLHALELNFQAVNDIAWKPYAGIRYFSLDEIILDRTRQYESAPLLVGESSITTNVLEAVDVDNNLIGFQLGVRRDLWRIAGKIYCQGFVNTGMYCNLINRFETSRTTTTFTEVLDDDPLTPDEDETGTVQSTTTTTGNNVKTERTKMSFASEASLALVWKINNCCALRSGYEMLLINNVELADDAYLGNSDTHSMFYHGAFAGFEYRR